MSKTNLLMSVIIITVLVLGVVIAEPDPTGVTLTPGLSSRGQDPNVDNVTAVGGNVTLLNIDQTSITGIWQGFYGNITGEIVLENAAGHSFYDWTLETIIGEVYATRILVADWSTVNCTVQSEWEFEEASLNISLDASDGVNETYYMTTHPNFDVGNRPMTGCQSTKPHNSTGTSGDFWNVLLNSDPTNVVYVALIQDNADSFENSTADFELMVPVNLTTSNAIYYFYAELV